MEMENILKITAGGDGGRFDLGKIRFCERSFDPVRLYVNRLGGSGGERGLLRISGERYVEMKEKNVFVFNKYRGYD